MHMRTKALVLRAVDYKESDKILTLLTQESGKLTASARGCRKKGSPVAAGVQLLAWSDLVLYEYRGRWTVKEAAVEREFQGGIRDTVTGEVTLTINGVTITISEGGDVSIQTAGKISMKAQQIDLQGGSSLVL